MTPNLSNPTVDLTSLYEQDYYLWLETTVQLLQQGKLTEVDQEHLIDEIADMVRREKRALESNLEILLMHLLKYQYQPAKRSNSWRFTIYEHRKRINKAFRDSPSLKRYFQEIFPDAYAEARKMAAIETGLEIDTFPGESPFPSKVTLDPDYLPK
jgi:hypothetical protein